MSETQVQEILQTTPGQEAPRPITDEGPGASEPVKKEDQAAIKQVEDAAKSDDPDLARKFAALTKKQREIYLREQKLKESESLVQKYRKLEELKAKDPWAYAKESGLEMDALVQGAMKDGEPPSADDKIKALEDKIAAYEKSQAEKLENEKLETQKRQIDNFKKSIQDEVKKDSNRFEYLILEEEFDTVYAVIEGHFNKTREETGEGEILPILDAADKVEKWLEARAEKYRSTKKMGLKQDTPQTTPKKNELVPDDEKDSMRIGSSLNSSITATTSAPPPANETPEQAIRRIAAEFNAKKNLKKP